MSLQMENSNTAHSRGSTETQCLQELGDSAYGQPTDLHSAINQLRMEEQLRKSMAQKVSNLEKHKSTTAQKIMRYEKRIKDLEKGEESKEERIYQEMSKAKDAERMVEQLTMENIDLKRNQRKQGESKLEPDKTKLLEKLQELTQQDQQHKREIQRLKEKNLRMADQIKGINEEKQQLELLYQKAQENINRSSEQTPKQQAYHKESKLTNFEQSQINIKQEEIIEKMKGQIHNLKETVEHLERNLQIVSHQKAQIESKYKIEAEEKAQRLRLLENELEDAKMDTQLYKSQVYEKKMIIKDLQEEKQGCSSTETMFLIDTQQKQRLEEEISKIKNQAQKEKQQILQELQKVRSHNQELEDEISRIKSQMQKQQIHEELHEVRRHNQELVVKLEQIQLQTSKVQENKNIGGKRACQSFTEIFQMLDNSMTQFHSDQAERLSNKNESAARKNMFKNVIIQYMKQDQ